MGNTFWGKGGCISLSSLRSGHQDRIRHARDLLGELSVRVKGRPEKQWEASDHNAFLTPKKEEEGRRKKEISDFNTFLRRSWPGLWGVLTSEPLFRGNWVSKKWATSVLLLAQLLTRSSPREAQVWLKCSSESKGSSWSHHAPQSRKAEWRILMAPIVGHKQCHQYTYVSLKAWLRLNEYFKIKHKAISVGSLSFSKGIFKN